ncbi:hypothetical protein M407DRAFT_244104 [Tulasnella calospora MUT 4182]|uniref:Uncharacterized protein n=1 Tax=Tulasnella calospora MUT 4182 TaxID=1051891 RepID=A0A0C3QGF9_9AGAM|nr:hypothetical protein M407DRAFT_244104 [Tulasnella calospora MUT 4182]
MNTPQSMMIGWASLIAAAGVSYYYAKQEIDARRKLQRELGLRGTEKKEWYERLEQPSSKATPANPPTAGAGSLVPPTSAKPPDKSS